MPEPIFFGGGLPDPTLRPDIGPLVAEVLRDDPEASSYGGVWGYEPLREAVAERLGRRATTTLDAGNIVLTNGSAGALEAVANHLIRPGTVVAVEELTYPGAVDVFRQRGARIVTVPVDADGMDIDALAELLHSPASSDRPTVVYTIATCQSPTGTMLSDDRRARLVDLAAEAGFTIVQDDTYGEIVYEPPPRPLIGLDLDRVVHVGSFSKTLMPGLRLGWVGAAGAVCTAIAARRTDLGNPPAVQRAVARLFASGEYADHVTRIIPAYRVKRDEVLGALAASCGGLGQWRTPAGGFFVWFVLNDGDVADFEALAQDEGVTYFAGPYFSAGERYGRGIRLAYGQLPHDQLGEGIRRLGRAIERSRVEASPTSG